MQNNERKKRLKQSEQIASMSSGISKDGILNIVPPNSIDAEKALLSAILIDNSQANSVLGIINPEDFYDSVNAKIFRIISKLSEKNEPIDIITILHSLEKEQDSPDNASDFNYGNYLTSLFELPAGLFNIEQYSKIVKEKSTLRNLINASNKIRQKCYEQNEDIENIIDFTEKTIFDATEKDAPKNYAEVYPLIIDYFKKLTSKKSDNDVITGIHSGLNYLDEYTNGFQPSDLIIIAGRPSMGKTALSLCIAKNIALSSVTVIPALSSMYIGMSSRISSAL